MVRSGKDGIFFLRDFNWNHLNDSFWKLIVQPGDEVDDMILVSSQEELIEKFASGAAYNVFRFPKDLPVEPSVSS